MQFGDDARQVLKDGADKVYKAVSCTLGASGRNVSYQKFGKPRITNDGVTIARQIELENMFERQGAEHLKEAAEQTNREAGDGTTTSIVMAHAIFEEGLKAIKEGANPMQLRHEIEESAKKVVVELKARAIPISTPEELDFVANISVENPEIGKLVSEAVRTAGRDGNVVVEESEGYTIEKEEITGYQYDQGWTNPYLVTNPEKMEAVMENVPILVSNKSWNLINDFMPLLEELKGKGEDKLVIIADEISGELLNFFVVNRLKLRFHAVIVKKPYNTEQLEDIAALTGATAITPEKGIAIPAVSHLGKVKKAVVKEKSILIMGGGGDPSERVKEIKGQIAEAKDYDKEKLEDRLAKLLGKVVVIKVGAKTDTERKYLKLKIDDGVNAVKAAVEEGIVAGGGMTLARVAEKVLRNKETKGDEVLYMSCHKPLLKILENTGVDNSVDIVKQLSQSETSGYDALQGKIVPDMIKQGIIDPVKVTRSAFSNAVSLAALLLTTEAVIAEIPEK